MQYAGVDFDLDDYDAIRTAVPIPDIFDYSLTAGRDVFAWAQQCCTGQNRGIETVIYELERLGVPMRLEAPTVTGQTWQQRLSDPRGLAADTVKDNPIVLSQPRRAVSGIDVLRGNWLDTAVVKISGLPDALLDEFDEKVALVIYFENEEEANAQLLNINFLAHLDERRKTKDERISDAVLAAMHRINGGTGQVSDLRAMAEARTLKLAMVISGQGPEAFGMPEMFTPMQHINHNRALRPLVTILSDGRYSGVTYGAAIGHVTPEALRGGGILYLQTGDLLHLGLRRRRIDLLEGETFEATGLVTPFTGDLAVERASLGAERRARILARRRGVAPTNLLSGCTDASRGVVPLAVAEEAVEPYRGGD
jgi:dihydroxyacid dehydratase/phosphogluconate dehydratase